MVAAPYTGTLAIFVDGRQKSMTLSASDVDGEALVFPDGSTQNTLGSGPAVIRDVICTKEGTDTDHVQVFVNGIYIGYDIYTSSNLATGYNRQVQTTPIGISPGATVKFIQMTTKV